MSTPEIIQEQPRQPEVTPVVEHPVVSETLQQAGVQAPPQAPKPVVADNNQVIAQPTPVTPADTSHIFTVPVTIAKNEKELEKGAQGPANLSITWLDATWLRGVRRALLKGWQIVFG